MAMFTTFREINLMYKCVLCKCVCGINMFVKTIPNESTFEINFSPFRLFYYSNVIDDIRTSVTCLLTIQSRFNDIIDYPSRSSRNIVFSGIVTMNVYD